MVRPPSRPLACTSARKPLGGRIQHVRGPVEEAELREPCDTIPSPVPARNTPRATDTQQYPSARALQLVGHLSSRLTAAHHQDGPGGEIVGIAVTLRIELLDARREVSGEPGTAGSLHRTGGHDDHRRIQWTDLRLHAQPAVSTTAKTNCLGPRAHRTPKAVCPSLEVRHEVVPEHEPVRVRTLVLRPRQTDGPVRRDQGEAVPTALRPTVSQHPSVQNDVVYTVAGQVMAGGKTGLAGTNDNDFRSAHGVMSRARPWLSNLATHDTLRPSWELRRPLGSRVESAAPMRSFRPVVSLRCSCSGSSGSGRLRACSSSRRHMRGPDGGPGGPRPAPRAWPRADTRSKPDPARCLRRRFE